MSDTDCVHASPCGSCGAAFAGRICKLGLYGGKPSLGVCRNCKDRNKDVAGEANPDLKAVPHDVNDKTMSARPARTTKKCGGCGSK